MIPSVQGIALVIPAGSGRRRTGNQLHGNASGRGHTHLVGITTGITTTIHGGNLIIIGGTINHIIVGIESVRGRGSHYAVDEGEAGRGGAAVDTVLGQIGIIHLIPAQFYKIVPALGRKVGGGCRGWVPTIGLK